MQWFEKTKKKKHGEEKKLGEIKWIRCATYFSECFAEVIREESI